MGPFGEFSFRGGDHGRSRNGLLSETPAILVPTSWQLTQVNNLRFNHLARYNHFTFPPSLHHCISLVSASQSREQLCLRSQLDRRV